MRPPPPPVLPGHAGRPSSGGRDATRIRVEATAQVRDFATDFEASSASSSRPRSTRAISDATSAISASPSPAVVSAAEPSRSPLATKGGRGSPGMALRLHVIPARSSTSWATLPVRSASKLRRSTSTRWLSVPPATRRKPFGRSAPPRAPPRCARPWRRSRANSGCSASPKATALAAMTCSSGPPCRPGKTAESTALARSAPQRMAPPRGPRSVLWVVKVTKSATPTGFGMHLAGDEPGRVGGVEHEARPDLVGDLAERHAGRSSCE